MATINGITFNELARQLATSGHLYLPARTSNAIAFMFGSSPLRLQRAFVRRYFRDTAFGAEFIGHQFLRPYHLRQTRPQVCSLCLREKLRALAAWSICLVTACPVHRIRLLDKCVCGRPISWRRPSIDFCECGQRLVAPDQPTEAADARELAISSQITYLLGTAHFRLRVANGLPSALDDISIDTFLRLVWAFGIVPPNQDANYPSSTNRTLPTVEAAGLVCRAFDRLTSVLGDRKSRRDTPIAHSALAALYADCSSTSDIRVVEAVLRRLYPASVPHDRRRPRDVDRQLSLFESVDD